MLTVRITYISADNTIIINIIQTLYRRNNAIYIGHSIVICHIPTMQLIRLLVEHEMSFVFVWKIINLKKT